MEDRCGLRRGGTAVTDQLRDHTLDEAGAVRAALDALDLDTKAALLAGQDMWSLPAVPGIGLDSLVMSDGPIGVRGVRWTADDPSVALPSPTALAATWDPELARRAGRLLAQEARRKGVHVLLAPTVNLHRSPLGGRHFEAYSEDPCLTGLIGAAYVAGVQDGGVAATVKHFVANDAETERFTVDNRIDEATLRELYLAPFEHIVRHARPWAVMSAYNAVNGTTMTEHRRLQREVLREEWGFDGAVVSDWMAARDTVRALRGGLDIAMPGPRTVYGPALAAAVRDGRVAEAEVDAAVRRVLRLAARTGALTTAPAPPPPAGGPADGAALAREIARRSFVLLRNERRALPVDPGAVARIALIGGAARDARVQGGGSAQVFPARTVAPLDGLRAALPDSVALEYATGAEPTRELGVAGPGFALRAVVRAADGRVLGERRLPGGELRWLGGDLPAGVTFDELHSIEITGTFTPRVGGRHSFGTRGLGGFRLSVGGVPLYDGRQGLDEHADPFEAFFGAPVVRGEAELTAGRPVDIALGCVVARIEDAPVEAVGFGLMHREPERDPDRMIEEAVATAAAADVAVVVVATTERVESEGFDRTDLRLPGRQDELVDRVAAANPRTVVVVNSGAPVELPWREKVAAVLLGWFPGQEAGAALADVLLGAEEPGGRLPTTWPGRLAEAPVTRVVPDGGRLPYAEGPFIGHAAWERSGAAPAYWFGHGLGYTDWAYEHAAYTPAGQGDGSSLGTVTVRVRNTGTRPGREIVQLYLTAPDGAGTPTGGPGADGAAEVRRPARRLAGFASVRARPGEAVEAVIEVPRSAARYWHPAGAADGTGDPAGGGWRLRTGRHLAEAGRSVADRRLSVPVEVTTD
ncbi:beta-glucosidase [Streptomyces sp. NPDC018031]|uniref:beta-glucosidase n=1 Tax=Streptomyces sp. NPDC018031 TaxID=3365033 RepID=UPI0037987CE8